MSWTPSAKEVAEVSASDGAHRYEYFIHRVCEARAVWALYHEGWASVEDGGQTLIPLWPHPAFAQPFTTGDWAGFAPRKIALEEFLAQWVPGMGAERIGPAVFPVRDGTSVVVGLDDLDHALRTELSVVHGVDLEE